MGLGGDGDSKRHDRQRGRYAVGVGCSR